MSQIDDLKICSWERLIDSYTQEISKNKEDRDYPYMRALNNEISYRLNHSYTKKPKKPKNFSDE
jgi:hypothetical protein